VGSLPGDSAVLIINVQEGKEIIDARPDSEE